MLVVKDPKTKAVKGKRELKYEEVDLVDIKDPVVTVLADAVAERKATLFGSR